MKLVGMKYKNEEIYIAKILSAARCMKYGLQALHEYLNALERIQYPKRPSFWVLLQEISTM